MTFAKRGAPGAALLLMIGGAFSADAIGPRTGSEVVAPAPAPRPAPAAAPSAPPAPALPAVAPTPPPPALLPLARLRHLLPPKAWYGVSLRCSDCSIRRDGESRATLEWRFRSEPEIASVEAGSPAERAGVKEGDKITQIDGVKITTPDGSRRFGAAAPGEKVRWTVLRDGKSVDLQITAGERPEEWSAWAGEQDALRRAEQELERASQQFRVRVRGADLDLDSQRKALAEAQRQLEVARRQLRQSSGGWYPWDGEGTPAPEAEEHAADQARRADEARARRLRYQGDVGSSHVEVRGSSRVVVTEDDDGNVVIDTPDATIKVEKKP